LKILLVVDNFIPEIGSAANVYYDLARGFIKNGHEVHVITMYPREFYLSKENKGKTFPMDEVVDDIHIHRAKFKFALRDNVIMRGMEHYLVPRLYYKVYKRLGIKFDGIIFYIPPYPLYMMANWIRKRDGTKSILNVQDIHPQELVDVGMVTNPLVIKFLEWIERRTYKSADHITVLSPSGVDLIVERGGDPERTQCIYNSVDIEEFQKNLKKMDYKQIEGIEDKFLISYAGIINSFQGIDDILDVAKRFIEDPDIIFYIVGDGMETDRLRQRVKNENITNVVMKPLQPKNVYYNIINSSDISIVSLDRRMTAPCIPGKFVNLMAAGKCIIANVPKVNDVYQICKEENSGLSVVPGNIDEFEKVVKKIIFEPELKITFQKNGINFVKKHMNIKKTIESYIEIFIKRRNST